MAHLVHGKGCECPSCRRDADRHAPGCICTVCVRRIQQHENSRWESQLPSYSLPHREMQRDTEFYSSSDSVLQAPSVYQSLATETPSANAPMESRRGSHTSIPSASQGAKDDRLEAPRKAEDTPQQTSFAPAPALFTGPIVYSPNPSNVELREWALTSPVRPAPVIHPIGVLRTVEQTVPPSTGFSIFPKDETVTAAKPQESARLQKDVPEPSEKPASLTQDFPTLPQGKAVEMTRPQTFAAAVKATPQLPRQDASCHTHS
ncbi:hypothetical protein ABEF95_003456 [Exophiala dermatitidis]